MEIHQLRYTVALARELNFGRAARKAHVSQPTLSQQIKKLEDELGVSLFERTPQKVRLTASGEKFLAYAVQALDSIDKAARELRDDGSEPSGLVMLGAIPTLGPYVLPGILRAIRKEAPGIRLEFFEETTSVLLRRLKEAQLDLGLLALPITEPGLVCRHVGKENFYLAVPKGHELTKKKSVKAADLRKENLLILQEGHCFADQALEYCGKSRYDDNVVFQGSSLTSVMKLAAAGEGVTLVPALAREQKAFPDLCFLGFSPPRPVREIGMVWRVSAPLTRAQRFVIEKAEEVLKQELARSGQ